MTSESLINFYVEATNCNQSCVGIRNERENGAFPRSFYCPSEPENVTLLIVSKNPGIGHPDAKSMFSSLSDVELLKTHDDFIRARFEGRNDLIKSKFHANMIDWVSLILDVDPSHDSVFKHAAKTALVKCESQSDKTAILPSSTISECASRWLWREIQIIQPKYLLSLGNEVHRYLTRSDIQELHNLPVGKLQHPSWTNMKGGVKRYKNEVLPALRREYLAACGLPEKHVS